MPATPQNSTDFRGLSHPKRFFSNDLGQVGHRQQNGLKLPWHRGCISILAIPAAGSPYGVNVPDVNLLARGASNANGVAVALPLTAKSSQFCDWLIRGPLFCAATAIMSTRSEN
jgi:hypothetical protein